MFDFFHLTSEVLVTKFQLWTVSDTHVAPVHPAGLVLSLWDDELRPSGLLLVTESSQFHVMDQRPDKLHATPEHLILKPPDAQVSSRKQDKPLVQ